MSDDYDRWNDALAKHLLQPREGQPFFLYVDRSVLADASGLLNEAEAVADFTAAVRARCQGREPLRWSRELARGWRDDGYPGAPPVLAVLGMTVLAAAERSTAYFQYYDDLNRLLARPVDAKMPPGFDVDVPYVFQALNAWLERAKQFGLPTARTHPHWSNVGWPLSQALLRPADGRELVGLMHRARLTPGGRLGGQTLLKRVMPQIRVMADSPTRRRLIDAVDRFPEMVQDRLLKEYESWTGATPVAERPSRVDLRLAHEDGYGDWWFVGRRPPESNFTRIRLGSWESSLHARGSLEVVHPDPWSLLGRGEVGVIDEYVAVHAPAAGPKWLRLDRDVGGWLEQPSSDEAVEQLRLLPARHQSEIAAWRARGVQEVPTAPDGWTLLRVPPGTRLTGNAQPSPASRQPWLEGGLCLNPATRTYMRSRRGMPVVAGLSAQDVLEVDGHPQAGHDGRVTLPPLEPGEHLVCRSDWQMRLRVVERLQEELQVNPELGWCSNGDRLRLTLSSQDVSGFVAVGAWVTGAQAPQPTTQVPFRTDTIWVFGHDGEVAKRDVRPLPWLADLGISGSATDIRRGLLALDFAPAFGVAFQSFRSPAWVVEVIGEPSSSTRERGVTQLEVQQLIQRLLSAGVQPLASDVERRWKRALARVIRDGAR